MTAAFGALGEPSGPGALPAGQQAVDLGLRLVRRRRLMGATDPEPLDPAGRQVVGHRIGGHIVVRLVWRMELRQIATKLLALSSPNAA